jgi:CTP:molybdopterin cytidylyltransferase MocA
MSAVPETLAIIPARGGSKGVPRKSLALLGGRPLIAWTIEAALRCAGITRVIALTEDAEIAEVSRACGAEVPFLRPLELAQDHSDLDDSFRFAMERLAEQGYRPRHVAHLFPTSPFRPAWLMDLLVERLHRGHQNVHTVAAVDAGQAYYAIGPDGVARARVAARPERRRSYGIFSGYCTFSAPFGPHAQVVEDPVLLIDIDEPEDLLRAEAVLRCGLKP